MSRSPYIDNIVLTNKHSGKRTEKVQAFVIHHMAAVWTGKQCAEYFRDTPRQASANYCIGYDGDVALNVEEENRAWTSSSSWVDQRAITYELANSKSGHPWEVSGATLNKTILMLAEHHKRYGLKEASYTGDTTGTLWRHDWFAQTNCPGPYLGGKLSYIAEEVNKILNQKTDKQLAEEVIKGLHGTGAERKAKLGSRYDAIQKLVNEILNPKPKPKPVVKPKPTSYKETGTFYPNDTIIVRNAPSTSATIVARYYKGEYVRYHTVHLKNGYVWLQYTRYNGQQAYIPCRTYSNGKYGPLWGTIK